MRIREHRARTGKIGYSDLCSTCKQIRYIEGVKQEIQAMGYDLMAEIPSDYHPRHTPLSVRCVNGHVDQRKMEHIRSSPKCNRCRFSAGGWFENASSIGIPVIEKLGKNRAKLRVSNDVITMSISQICDRYSIDPFTLFNYTKGPIRSHSDRSDRSRYHTSCPEGHSFPMSTRSLLEGHGCRVCSLSQLNDPERIIGGWVENAGLTITRRDNTIIQGKEVDIYIPSLKIGIEYTGIRWHSLENLKAPITDAKLRSRINHLLEKKIMASNVGVNLITVFESEFIHDREELKYRILEIISGTRKNIGDLRYDPIDPQLPILPPRPRYFRKNYEEVANEDHAYKYTVYDCGSQFVAMEKPL